MKQPDLGKKIAELRLAKGLTQSELVLLQLKMVGGLKDLLNKEFMIIWILFRKKRFHSFH